MLHIGKFRAISTSALHSTRKATNTNAFRNYITQKSAISRPFCMIAPSFPRDTSQKNFYSTEGNSGNKNISAATWTFPFGVAIGAGVIGIGSYIWYQDYLNKLEIEEREREILMKRERLHREEMLVKQREQTNSTFSSVRVVARFIHLGLIFLPATLALPLVYLLSFATSSKVFWNLWWDNLRHRLERAGPLWMKLGQWAATRPDLFSDESCFQLGKLHSSCPTHPYRSTSQIIQATLKQPISDLFLQFETNPIASGAIAQVHHAVLKDGTEVAVKVRHPNADFLVYMDLTILDSVARMIGAIPNVKYMGIVDAMDQFKLNMLAQLDMRLEADHLYTFRYNFRNFPNVTFPAPIENLTSDAVLVETFEKGESISNYFGRNDIVSKKLATIGINAYMKMMLRDHYVHADLHPGNILVRVNAETDANPRNRSPDRKNGNPQLIFLDVGLVTEMSPNDADHFEQLFKAVIEGNGKLGGELMIKYAREPPKFKNEEEKEEFKARVNEVFTTVRTKKFSEIDVGDTIGRIMRLTRDYRVKLEGNFSTLVLGTALLEGIGRQLDRDLSLLDAAIPFVRASSTKSGIEMLQAYLRRIFGQTSSK